MGSRVRACGRCMAGILDVHVHHAAGLQSFSAYGEQDVYARFFFGEPDPLSDAVLQTRTIRKGGTRPIFDQSLQIGVPDGEQVLRCEVFMAQPRGRDQLLGAVKIPLDSILLKSQKQKRPFEYRLVSSYLEAPAGTLSLTLGYHDCQIRRPASPQAASTPKAAAATVAGDNLKRLDSGGKPPSKCRSFFVGMLGRGEEKVEGGKERSKGRPCLLASSIQKCLRVGTSGSLSMSLGLSNPLLAEEAPFSGVEDASTAVPSGSSLVEARQAGMLQESVLVERLKCSDDDEELGDGRCMQLLPMSNCREIKEQETRQRQLDKEQDLLMECSVSQTGDAAQAHSSDLVGSGLGISAGCKAVSAFKPYQFCGEAGAPVISSRRSASAMSDRSSGPSSPHGEEPANLPGQVGARLLDASLGLSFSHLEAPSSLSSKYSESSPCGKRAKLCLELGSDVSCLNQDSFNRHIVQRNRMDDPSQPMPLFREDRSTQVEPGSAAHKGSGQYLPWMLGPRHSAIAIAPYGCRGGPVARNNEPDFKPKVGDDQITPTSVLQQQASEGQRLDQGVCSGELTHFKPWCMPAASWHNEIGACEQLGATADSAGGDLQCEARQQHQQTASKWQASVGQTSATEELVQCPLVSRAAASCHLGLGFAESPPLHSQTPVSSGVSQPQPPVSQGVGSLRSGSLDFHPHAESSSPWARKSQNERELYCPTPLPGMPFSSVVGRSLGLLVPGQVAGGEARSSGDRKASQESSLKVPGCSAPAAPEGWGQSRSKCGESPMGTCSVDGSMCFPGAFEAASEMRQQDPIDSGKTLERQAAWVWQASKAMMQDPLAVGAGEMAQIQARVKTHQQAAAMWQASMGMSWEKTEQLWQEGVTAGAISADQVVQFRKHWAQSSAQLLQLFGSMENRGSEEERDECRRAIWRQFWDKIDTQRREGNCQKANTTYYGCRAFF